MASYWLYQVDELFVNHYKRILKLEEYEEYMEAIVINKSRVCLFWVNGTRVDFEGLVMNFGVCKVTIFFKDKIIVESKNRVLENEMFSYVEHANNLEKLVCN